MPRDVVIPFLKMRKPIQDPDMRAAVNELDAAVSALIADSGRLFVEITSQSRSA